jgi:hypothetical protein
VTAMGEGAHAATLTLLLPARARLSGDLRSQRLLATWLARADRSASDAGDAAQLLRHFEVLPRGLPVAALTRQLDLHDAQPNAWLRADPAHLRADLGAGRLLACGDLGLSVQETDELLRALKPLFGDEGFPISAGTPARWYLMLPRDAQLPAFAPPDDVLGDDIFAHLPQGDAGRRWRRLLSEAQVLLHNHPVNARRVERGQPAVNSLWFWGAGTLPDSVAARGASAVVSDEPVLCALAERAGLRRHGTAAMTGELLDAGVVVDLRTLRSVDEFDYRWAEPIRVAQGARRFESVWLDFADGVQCRWHAAHRWRVWRRAAVALG